MKSVILFLLLTSFVFAEDRCSHYFSTRGPRKKDTGVMGEVYPRKAMTEIEAGLKKAGVKFKKGERILDPDHPKTSMVYLEILPDSRGHKLNKFADGVNKKLFSKVIYCPQYLDAEQAYGEFVPDLEMLFVSDLMMEKIEVTAVDLHESLHGHYNKLLIKGKESTFHMEAQAEAKDGLVSKYGKQSNYLKYYSFEEANTFTLALRAMISEYRRAVAAESAEEAEAILASILETSDQIRFVYKEATDIAKRSLAELKKNVKDLHIEVVEKQKTKIGNEAEKEKYSLIEATILIDEANQTHTKYIFPESSGLDPSVLSKKIIARSEKMISITEGATEKIETLPAKFFNEKTKKLTDEDMDKAMDILGQIRKLFSDRQN